VDAQSVKAILHKRLHAEKRWEDYLLIREALKRDGIAPAQAWRYAAKEFPPLDGSPPEIDQLNAKIGVDEQAREDPRPTPPPPPAAVSEKGWIEYSRSVSDQSVGTSEIWAKLIHAVHKQNRSAGTREISEWVARNAIIPIALISADDVPDTTALGLLKWVQQSTVNYSEFVKTVWSKTMPKESTLNAEGRFADDGRLQLAMLDEFEATFDEQGKAA
jgi:hypothetical protein